MLEKFFLVVLITNYGLMNNGAPPAATMSIQVVYGEDRCNKLGKAIEVRWKIDRRRSVDFICEPAK